MKIPPKKPHFFKPILPGFKNGIKIPVGFLTYLKGYEHIKRAVLKRGDKKWRIKVNEHRFEEGNWGKFVEENDLQLGDLLVFRHEGNMEFEVSVFDSSHCDREYAEYMQEEGERRALSVREISKKFEFKANVSEKSKRNFMSSHKAFRDIEAAKDIPLSHPHFVCTLKSYCLSKYSLRVPVSFARLNGLKNRKCTITIRDKRRSWTFKLYAYGVDTYIVGGWRKFCIVNCLKEGDYLMFEILDNGEKPILKFHDMRGNASLQPEGKKINLDAKSVAMAATGIKTKTSYVTTPKAQVPTSTSTNDTNPHFISIIKPYSICKHFLYIPLAFAKSNGWLNRCCEMILIDEQQRSWSVRLGLVPDHHIGIHSGWQKFKEANDVQVGDIYRFELISNGKIPVAYFHRNYSGKDAKQSP